MSARQSLWVAESGPWAVVSCSPAHRPVNKLSVGQVGCNPAESIGAIATPSPRGLQSGGCGPPSFPRARPPSTEAQRRGRGLRPTTEAQRPPLDPSGDESGPPPSFLARSQQQRWSLCTCSREGDESHCSITQGEAMEEDSVKYCMEVGPRELDHMFSVTSACGELHLRCFHRSITEPEGRAFGPKPCEACAIAGVEA
ncbi:hypothetical protein B296_00039894 [Ensete ventricosum]|uniref:Uncharacterized protein n=1 Tax=Ensete ventricosum TaxID=4639 RepID=A0A426XQ44_ENSVE|nr:hypothetical protein B296_00039894 [Ensete ventricosum]